MSYEDIVAGRGKTVIPLIRGMVFLYCVRVDSFGSAFNYFSYTLAGALDSL